ncbi:MAG: pyridoxal-phosphate dependent enzyme [Gammaproteobacteria bacterium]
MSAVLDNIDIKTGREVMDDIRAAATRLEGVARRTPVITSRTLDDLAGGSVFLKCENLQNVGAFKFRGAYNALSQLSDAQRAAGVLTYSSGNHGQAVARVGQLLGIETVIVMPDNAPEAKLAATRGYGAKVITFNPHEISREEVAAKLPEAKTHTLIPPFDHYDVIAGQGTCAVEIHEDTPPLDQLLVCTGGAGLLAGCSVATHFLQPGCQVIGVEPALADDAARSLRSGKIEVAQNTHRTIADGTRTPSVGRRNFALVQAYTHDIVTVSEAAIERAVLFAFERLKLVMEPSGALGLAAVLEQAVPLTGRTGVIVSGGNIDLSVMQNILANAAT